MESGRDDMIKSEMKNCIMTLAELEQRYLHFHRVR